MQKQLFSSNHSRALKALLTLALTVGIIGCASKNPLMEGADSAAVASTRASIAASTAAPAPAVAVTAEKNSSAQSGTHTIAPTGARRFLGLISPYRVTIPQGNFVSKEMLADVKEGMTRDQVKFALGTPLMTDIFHADRWDYIFRLVEGNGQTTQSRVTVLFKEDRLVRIEGGDLPTENDYLARIAGSVPSKKKTAVSPQPAHAPSSVPEPSKQ